jgi:hypothetical protein
MPFCADCFYSYASPVAMISPLPAFKRRSSRRPSRPTKIGSLCETGERFAISPRITTTMGRVALWCPAPQVSKRRWSGSTLRASSRRPPQREVCSLIGSGVYLDTIGDGTDDWDEVAAIVIDAYRSVAPKALVAELETQAEMSNACQDPLQLETHHLAEC